MKKFNLFNEIIVVDRAALMQAINAGREFGITTTGEVVAQPTGKRHIYIYRGVMTPPKPSPLMPQKAAPSLAELFGTNYRIVEDDDRVLIKAASAWQEIIGFNLRHCDYDDTSADGISHFPDEALEEIGWHATEFNVDYRDIVELIEAECEGTLLCIEQNEPYQFSGMGFIDDMESARSLAFAFCKGRITTLMAEDPDYAAVNLAADEEEAAEFFGLV
jgi:hypothetical protein